MHVIVDSSTAERRRDELAATIGDEAFPCVGAKSALARGQLHTVACRSIVSGWDDMRIHDVLLQWVRDYRRDPSGLRSLAVTFEEPVTLSEEAFERAMWQRLQSLADKDEWRGLEHDRSVSLDPEDAHFALSFGGAAFFVVGLHPSASRVSRRFPRPTLVFNLHDQFERLRAEGRYDRMRNVIVRRDAALCGTVNPMLHRFGDASGARQYSGRVSGEEWKCPFHDPRAG